VALSRYLLAIILCFSAPLALGQDEERNTDPWEPMNRKIFAFNEGLDKYLLKPIARGYRFITPDPVEKGVSNFILNIYDFNGIINSILQGRPADAVHITGRFFINTTLGLAGFIDVATHLGVEYRPRDFGQTLAVWGVDQGPFLMLPVLGPRTVRSGIGQIFDTYTGIPYQIDDQQFTYAYFALEVIDIRAQLLKAEEMVSGDKYIFTREVYLQRREYWVIYGEVDDSFSDFEEDEDFEEF
jgi:phospholipid-binding lipoprotein MlaA